MLLASLGSVRLGTTKTEENKGEGVERGWSVFRNHRSKLILIAAVAIVALVALATAAVVTQRDDRASANEPSAGLGIDPMKGTCPKVEPEKLPPDALAGATEAALDQVPSVFGHVVAYIDGEARTTEGAYAAAAHLAKGGPSLRSRMIREGSGCSKLLQDRSVVVELQFPDAEPSASLSQHTVFVARFRGDYRIWGIGH